MGSACEFPRGSVDPIPEMSKIAKEHKFGFHVDGCLGGYMLPFLRELGYPIPDFDFLVPGVTSISADIHKYGMTPKGSSTLLFRNERVWKSQFHAWTKWMGGIYASPTMGGTRPGSILAGAWAGMKHMGKDGYLEMAQKTMEAAISLRKGISSHKELEILGDPVMTVHSFKSVDKDVNIFALGDVLKMRGWMLDKLQFPGALHQIVIPFQYKVVDEFLSDLDWAIEYTKEHPEMANEGTAGMYGMMAQFDDREKIEDLVLNFLADQYKSR